MSEMSGQNETTCMSGRAPCGCVSDMPRAGISPDAETGRADGQKGERPGGRCVGRSSNNANANGGLVYANANNASSNSNTNNGSRLTLRNTPGAAALRGDNRHTAALHELEEGRRREARPSATANMSEIPASWESGNITSAPEGADIPPFCTDGPEPLIAEEQYPIADLVSEITSERNLCDSFDYVVSHLVYADQRAKFRPLRERYIAKVRKLIRAGAFRIDRSAMRDLTVKDGPKVRVVQVPTVFDRFACHAVMAVVERHCFPALIDNAAACIKGKGMHWLHLRLHEDIRAVPDMTRYYCQTDIAKFYDNIDQKLMKREIRRYISDPVLLPILDDFISVLPQGLSKGLRSSQVFANLYMAPVDEMMTAECAKYVLETEEGEVLRTMYARYMDDAYWWSGDKKELWRLLGIYIEACAERGLTVKPSVAVRPLTEGFDALGYVDYGTHVRLRKRVKQRFARHIGKVKSRKRRQELIGSFKGMAQYADAKHLFKTLTRRTMIKFSELVARGVKYTPADGKKHFRGERVSLGQLVNIPIIVLDYEREVKTPYGDGRYIVSCRYSGTEREVKFFTNSAEMKSILDQVQELGQFPFEATIRQQTADGKRFYSFT